MSNCKNCSLFHEANKPCYTAAKEELSNAENQVLMLVGDEEDQYIKDKVTRRNWLKKLVNELESLRKDTGPKYIIRRRA